MTFHRLSTLDLTNYIQTSIRVNSSLGFTWVARDEKLHIREHGEIILRGLVN